MMDSNLLAILAGCLISIGHTFELFGFFFRVLGAEFGKPSLGYSSHVQIATISRLSTLLAMPIVGYLLDKSVSINTILLVPISSLIIFISLSAAQVSLSYKKGVLVIIFKFFVALVSRVKVVNTSSDISTVKKKAIPKSMLKKIYISGFLAFLIITGGVFSIYLISAANLNYRAMILQSAPIFTSIGTLISVVFFDSTVSNVLDTYKYDMSLIRIIIKARVYAALLLLMIFFTFLLLGYNID